MRTGAILKACRQKSGLSQEELADSLYINQSDISKYENDTREPSVNMFQQWMANTQTQEVAIAFIYGIDGINILQSLFDSGIATVGMILLGGIM